MTTGVLWQLFKGKAAEWMDAKPFRLAAALAYYKLFPMAALLVVTIGIAGLVFGADATRGQILGPLQSMLGPKSANAVQNAVAAVSIKSSLRLEIVSRAEAEDPPLGGEAPIPRFTQRERLDLGEQRLLLCGCEDVRPLHQAIG